MHFILDYFIYMQFQIQRIFRIKKKGCRPIIMPIFPSLSSPIIFGSFGKDHLVFCPEFNREDIGFEISFSKTQKKMNVFYESSS